MTSVHESLLARHWFYLSQNIGSYKNVMINAFCDINTYLILIVVWTLVKSLTVSPVFGMYNVVNMSKLTHIVLQV